MMEFVQQAAKQLGIEESASRSLTGGLLGLIQQNAGSGEFSQLLAKLPGAENLLSQVKKSVPAKTLVTAAPGGITGDLMGRLAGVVGGQSGAAMGLMGMFKDAGIGADQGQKFVTMFVAFIKSKAGSDLVGKLFAQVPALKQLVG